MSEPTYTLTKAQVAEILERSFELGSTYYQEMMSRFDRNAWNGDLMRDPTEELNNIFIDAYSPNITIL